MYSNHRHVWHCVVGEKLKLAVLKIKFMISQLIAQSNSSLVISELLLSEYSNYVHLFITAMKKCMNSLLL